MIRYCAFLLLITFALSDDHDIFPGETHLAGYINLGASREYGELYYILFKSRDENPNAPLIWFFEGGPGQSSMHGLFYQNGPFRLVKDHLVRNEYSLNNIADVLYLDQPLGTGFSNCTNTSHVPHHETVIVNDLVHFINAFEEIHPEYHQRPLYLFSQGYGSHFVLPLAKKLLDGFAPLANVQGIALGNPVIRPELQMASIASFSKRQNLTTEFKYIASLYGYVLASIFIDLDYDVPAFDLIQMAHGVIIGAHHHAFNRLDYRIKCATGRCMYNFTELNHFLDLPDVRRSMDTIGRPFNYTSREVFHWLLLKNEYLSDKSDSLINLLDKSPLPIYIYTGEYDWQFNTLGIDEVMASLHWKGRHQFHLAPWKNWYSDGILRGKYKHYKHLYYAHVYNAGHYVGMDVPSFTLDLMTRLIYGSQ